jgi:hypothetical protein
MVGMTRLAASLMATCSTGIPAVVCDVIGEVRRRRSRVQGEHIYKKRGRGRGRAKSEERRERSSPIITIRSGVLEWPTVCSEFVRVPPIHFFVTKYSPHAFSVATESMVKVGGLGLGLQTE